MTERLPKCTDASLCNAVRALCHDIADPQIYVAPARGCWYTWRNDPRAPRYYLVQTGGEQSADRLYLCQRHGGGGGESTPVYIVDNVARFCLASDGGDLAPAVALAGLLIDFDHALRFVAEDCVHAILRIDTHPLSHRLNILSDMFSGKRGAQIVLERNSVSARPSRLPGAFNNDVRVEIVFKRYVTPAVYAVMRAQSISAPPPDVAAMLLDSPIPCLVAVDNEESPSAE